MYSKPITQEIPVLKYFNGVNYMNKLPYTHTSEELNNKVTEVMNEWDKFIAKVKSLGFDIKLAPNTKTLELYFHDDYPDMILVDKCLSSEMEVK
jgi:hypothetical protein